MRASQASSTTKSYWITFARVQWSHTTYKVESHAAMLRNVGNERKTNFEISCQPTKVNPTKESNFFSSCKNRLNNLIKVPQFFKSAESDAVIGICTIFIALEYQISSINMLHYDSGRLLSEQLQRLQHSFSGFGILPFGGFGAAARDEINSIQKAQHSTVTADANRENLLKVQPQPQKTLFPIGMQPIWRNRNRKYRATLGA